MDPKLKAAIERVSELEDELIDQQVVIDLLHEDIEDLKGLNRSLMGQLQNLKLDRTYAVL